MIMMIGHKNNEFKFNMDKVALSTGRRVTSHHIAEMSQRDVCLTWRFRKQDTDRDFFLRRILGINELQLYSNYFN